jgi:hypothetical protein
MPSTRLRLKFLLILVLVRNGCALVAPMNSRTLHSTTSLPRLRAAQNFEEIIPRLADVLPPQRTHLSNREKIRGPQVLRKRDADIASASVLIAAAVVHAAPAVAPLVLLGGVAVVFRRPIARTARLFLSKRPPVLGRGPSARLREGEELIDVKGAFEGRLDFMHRVINGYADVPLVDLASSGGDVSGAAAAGDRALARRG